MKTKIEGLWGRRCDTCGEVEFDADGAHRDAAPGDALLRRERAPPANQRLPAIA